MYYNYESSDGEREIEGEKRIKKKRKKERESKSGRERESFTCPEEHLVLTFQQI